MLAKPCVPDLVLLRLLLRSEEGAGGLGEPPGSLSLLGQNGLIKQLLLMLGIDIGEGEDTQCKIHERVSRLLVSEIVDPVPHLDHDGEETGAEEGIYRTFWVIHERLPDLRGGVVFIEKGKEFPSDELGCCMEEVGKMMRERRKGGIPEWAG